MRKPAKSEWDFGELFQQPPSSPKVFSVTELTLAIRRTLEQQLGQVRVTGEITNFRLQSSGHIYFTLKDPNAQLTCVLFRGERISNRQVLQDGQKVVLTGELTVYEPRGQYQLRVTGVELQGLGALQQEFERLKAKLRVEGLFAPERKRALPKYPQRIGIVTSATGAAIRDVLHVVQRRQPGLEMILVSCRVQGTGAGNEVAAAIRLLNEFHEHSGEIKLDLILVTRGGGSLEDLWAFNEEVVARAIFESQLPIVSAVGHEIDFTISDFVADFRAATPSAAAEIITEGVYASGQFVGGAADLLKQLILNRLRLEGEALDRLSQRLQRSHPRRKIQERVQYVDDLSNGLLRCVKFHIRDDARNFLALRQRLDRMSPDRLFVERAAKFRETHRRFLQLSVNRFKVWQARAAGAEERLRLLSPVQVLQRGYSITRDAVTGNVIRNASEVSPGQELVTQVEQGSIGSVVR